MIDIIEKYAKENMQNIPAHDYGHVNRVRRWALIIAKEEGFKDLEAIEVAALLHDIGRGHTENEKQHGEMGAEIAQRYLKENGFFTDEVIADVCGAIRYHCTNRKGEGTLLNILRDADKLDLSGAVGIWRVMISKYLKPYSPDDNLRGETWKMGAVDFDRRFDSGIGQGEYIVDEINFCISCYDNFATETAKKLAKPFVDYMIGFVKEMEKEVNNTSE